MDLNLIPAGEHEQNILALFEDCTLSNIEELKHNDNLTVICFTNRCGSTYVCSVFSQLGLAGKPEEYNYEFLNHDMVRRISLARRLVSFSEYFKYLINTYSCGGNFLVKASVDQLHFLLKIGLFRAVGKKPKVILVTRRDIIAQAVSYCVANQDKQWTSLHETPPRDFIPAFNPTEIMVVARQIVTQNAWFELLFDFHQIESIKLIYEDVAADRDGLLKRLYNIYGLSDDQQLQPTLLPIDRQNSRLKKVWTARLRDLGVKAWASPN